MMAGYNVISWLPSVPYARTKLVRAQWWWVAVFCTGLVGTTVMMVIRAARTQSVRAPAVAYALLTLGAVATAHWGLPEVPTAREPWIWWLIGPSVVCAAIGAGLAWGTAYGAVLGLCFAVFRSTSAGGLADLRTAISQGLFAPAAALAIAAVALGMLKAARRADDLALAAYTREAAAAMDRALAAERDQLDRLVHDDVLTTLTAAAHAQDRAAVEATKSLGSATLVKLEELCSKTDTDGAVTLSGLAQLAQTSAQQVSPAVLFEAALPESLDGEKLPAGAAEALLDARSTPQRRAPCTATSHRCELAYDKGRASAAGEQPSPGRRCRIRRGLCTGRSTRAPAFHGRAHARRWRNLLDFIGAGSGNDRRAGLDRRVGGPRLANGKSPAPGRACASRRLPGRTARDPDLAASRHGDLPRIAQRQSVHRGGAGPAGHGRDVCSYRGGSAHRTITSAADVGGGQLCRPHRGRRRADGLRVAERTMA